MPPSQTAPRRQEFRPSKFTEGFEESSPTPVYTQHRPADRQPVIVKPKVKAGGGSGCGGIRNHLLTNSQETISAYFPNSDIHSLHAKGSKLQTPPTPSHPVHTANMPSSSTHQDANSSPAPKTENKSRTSKFIEGPMHDSPSQPPPIQFLRKPGSAGCSSESKKKDTDTQTVGATPKHPTRCGSEPLESTSPKPTEKLPQEERAIEYGDS
ncbi:hypothetical protein BOTCAL_0064g00140 [Botryotinia calthae]|uniref:Uncharacterized protein n=1 Tax=Botryotinia calthae TaxID=38488 RepID=A0A4Y8D9H5_9HELO|nr:hypothetical protein BOTCAL_0064g00140 [Botryotinia calthae]